MRRLRRYLVPFNSTKLSASTTDILVIGSGSAALEAAIHASRSCNVLVATKKNCADSGSSQAQGGIAAAISDRDTTFAHLEDTLKAACGIGDEAVAKLCINEGKRRVQELIERGIAFDRDRENRLKFAREGGHNLPRILHKGDETGAELERILLEAARAIGAIAFRENTFAVDLLTEGGLCYGALVCGEDGRLEAIFAKKVIVASGGAGHLYRETTNPPVSTGDGIVMAYRAGAELRDLEFVQFHPTTLYLAGASRSLISEAVRGAGAVLRDRTGYAFMKDYHSMGDLAPRDVVSRSIIKQMKITDDTQVYLDLSAIPSQDIHKRFPNLGNLCNKYHLDERKIPVRPSAHYFIGGIAIDVDGKTNVRNLYACGECAASGFHGANRLGSNSLLECLVFGKRAGEHSALAASREKLAPPAVPFVAKAVANSRDVDVEDMKNSLKSLMWRNVGIERESNGLKTAIEFIEFWSRYLLAATFHTPDGWELQNLVTLSSLVARSALAREESRGVHFRSDFPETDDRRWKRRIVHSVEKGMRVQ